MRLRVLRLLENIFYNIGSYFEDCADSIDTEFHDELRRALDEPFRRLLDGDELCPICNKPEKEHQIVTQCPTNPPLPTDAAILDKEQL